jgi:uncharacterized protein (DUF849 family)
MRSLDDVIINCAITGGDHIPTLSPHIPVTPGELIEEGIAAAEAGASIVHIHVRDPETGEPVSDVELFREVARGIAAETNAIVQPTTGGSPGMSVEERIKVVPELEPEMASCNMGSINFGLFPILEKFDEFEHDWEAPFLEGTRDYVFENTFADLETVLSTFQNHGTKPELECYDTGNLYNVKYLVETGHLELPIHIQFVMGILGGIGADSDNLSHLVQTAEKLFGDDYSFSVIGAGRQQFPLGSQAVSRGGHVRVGLEDNVHIRKGELAESNAEQVAKMVDIVDELTGRDIATPETTREYLGLKGQDATRF